MFKNTNVLVLYLLFFSQIIVSQTIFVTGKVSDQSGPLPGVTILVKGTSYGTETDFNGDYKVKAKEGDILVFSFVGMKSKEKKVSSLSSVVNVNLEEDSNVLDEVEIIATGYDKASQKTFTGAASSLKSEDIKIDGVVDVTRMIEGKAAGVSIQNVSGTFGAAPKVTIRGSSSIFGNNSPLYVIDGVVQEDIVEADLDALASGNAETLISSSIAGINANDISKIDILKDASATSLYGAKARNGVVVITTKSGKKETPLKVSYTFEQTVSDIPRYTSFDILDSRESMSIFREIEQKGFLQLPKVAQARYGGVWSIMEEKINTYNPETGRFLLENTPEARANFLRQYELSNTDWFKILFRNSISQNHSLSLSGGGEKSTYYGSISYFNDPGWTIAENVKRLTTNLRTSFDLSEKMNLSLASIISIRDQRAPGTFERKTDDYNGEVSRDFDINPFSYALNTSRTLRPRDSSGNLEYYRNNWADFNILEELQNNYIDLNVKDIRVRANLSYKIKDNLTYDLNTSARYVNSTREHNVKEQSNVVRAYNADETTIIRNANIFLYKDPNNPTAIPVSVFPEGGIYTKDDNYLTSYYVRNSFKYNKSFNEVNDLDVLLGQELRYVDRDKNSFTGYGLQYNKGYVPFTDARLLEKLFNQGRNYFSLSKTRERTVAFFGKTTYSYKNKYIFSLTGRYDGSNRQGKSSSSRWLPTGTLSAKWDAKEDLVPSLENVNNLKFRASYGLVATPGSATNALTIYKSKTTNRFLPKNRETYLTIDALQNLDLTWEKQYELNFGVDLGLFNNRVALNLDIYKRNIFDNVDYVRTSAIGGFTIKKGNNADAVTKGVELNLRTKNIETDNFKWSTNFTFSHYNQEITRLDNTPSTFNLVDGTGGNVVGKPINSLFSFVFGGLNENGTPKFKLPEGVDQSTGADFQDTDDVTKYLKYEGPVEPNYSGGISNSFTYKNWNLNMLITASGGNKIRLNPTFSETYTDLNVFSSDFVNRWISPGDEKITNVPGISSLRQLLESNFNRAYTAYNYSTERVADGDFIRMKSVSLGYNFNKELVNKIGLSKLNVKLQGTNLFLLYSDDKLRGQDPEFYSVGGVAMPLRRQFTMSLNVGF